MALTRKQIVALIEELAGDQLKISDAGNGWPALGSLRMNGDRIPVAVFAAPVTLSHRNRDHVERRMQNPGQQRPIVVPPGHLPLLLGLWHEDSVMVVQRALIMGADAWLREGLQTRYSVFISVAALVEATVRGWSSYVNNDGETIIAFTPALLSTYAEMVKESFFLPSDQIVPVIDAAGLNEPEDEYESPSERARRAATSLVRRAGLGKKIVEAYRGLCAMCGLNFGLCQGAHIYPASAPKSPDTIWNGLALCGNHHAAFDKHLIFVQPDTLDVVVHPDLYGEAGVNETSSLFLETTVSTLRPPSSPAQFPRPEMFQQRYEYFDGRYGWVF